MLFGNDCLSHLKPIPSHPETLHLYSYYHQFWGLIIQRKNPQVCVFLFHIHSLEVESYFIIKDSWMERKSNWQILQILKLEIIQSTHVST